MLIVDFNIFDFNSSCVRMSALYEDMSNSNYYCRYVITTVRKAITFVCDRKAKILTISLTLEQLTVCRGAHATLWQTLIRSIITVPNAITFPFNWNADPLSMSLTLKKLAWRAIIALWCQLIREVITVFVSVTLIIYIFTNVDAIFLTQEEMVIRAIVTLFHRCVWIISTTSVTIAD